MLKRITVLLLALMMCMGAMFGCSSNGDGEETDDGTVSTSGADTEDDGIGAYDFGGAEFTILSRKGTSYEHIGNLGGDSISQKVYERNVAVETRFGVKINVIELDGSYDDRDKFITAVRAENMSPTGAYDLISTHSVYLGWLGMEGVAHDLCSLPEIDFMQDYWNKNLYNELNIDGKCYMMIGDIGYTLYEYISVLFVNTKLIEDNNIVDGGVDELYDMVENGKWTWGKLYEISKDYGLGLETPTYGLLFNAHALRAALMSQDAYFYVRDNEGKFYMESSASEHLVTAVENLSKFFTAENMYYPATWDTAETEENPMFTANCALFYAQTLGQSEKLKSMGDSYSVLPLPKFDEFQADYYTICRDSVTGIMVMNCAKNLDMSGVITQALGMYAKQLVTPEYYEKALKYRYNSDPRSVDMIDQIRDSLTICAVSNYYDTGIDFDMFSTIVRNGENEGIASKYAEYPARANNELKNFYSKLAALEG